MKLENRKQKVVPLKRFYIRLGCYSIFSFSLIFFSIGIGTLGYHFTAALSWLDSFHMTCMILTGMGPVAEMRSTHAILFSSFYALYSGVAFVSITAIFLAPIANRLLHILHVESTKTSIEEED